MKNAQVVIRFDDGRIQYDMAEAGNPCFGCGLCCRHFRVSFYHGELDTQPGGYVPAALASLVTPFRVCMQGTERGGGRCISLLDNGRCGIYDKRPSVCREFPAYLEDGTRNPECLRLQTLYGIAASR